MSDEPIRREDVDGTGPPPVEVTLEPSTSEGRREAEHAVGVRNRGLEPIRARVSASDEQGFLAFDVEPAELEVGAGGTSSSQLTVRARKRLIVRGRRLRPFRVSVSVNAAVLQVDGALLQRRFVPWWGVPMLVLLGLLLIVAVVLIVVVLVFILSNLG